jgi:hypothetical protein
MTIEDKDPASRITPNIEDYSSIIDAAQNGKLILFVGNGVSRLLGYPSWVELGRRAIDILYKEGHIEYSEKSSLLALNSKIQLSIFSDNYKAKGIDYDYGKLIFQDKEIAVKTEIYDALYSIGTVFVTTNYDDCLDKLADNKILSSKGDDNSLGNSGITSPTSVFFRKEDLTSARLDQPGSIIHLHGSVKSKETMIMTTRDYIDHYMNRFVIDFLNDLFSRKVVLFIGYGLEEEEILEFIVRKSNSPGVEEPKHFWLYPRMSRDNAAYKHLKGYFERHCGIKLIDYNIDKKGHVHLEEIIIKWAAVLKGKVNKPNFEEEKDVIRRLLNK